MQIADGIHLTYCTNIHPANGWAAVLATLKRHVLPLKARLAPDRPFGIGLRLSGQESRELLEGGRLAEFAAFLADHGLYVFTINGFPYAPFHRQTVKDQVHAPDWRDPERVAYTLRLAEILAALLPPGLDGGISTSPLSYKPWFASPDDAPWRQLTAAVVEVAAALAERRAAGGPLIHIDIEPEPDGLLETSAELAAFFSDWLLRDGAAMLAARLGCATAAAADHLREHVRACLDTCHCAVAYEAPADVLGRYAAAGIKVGKVQISSALRMDMNRDPAEVRAALEPFAEGTYLHQVIQRNRDGGLRQYPDLPQALSALPGLETACEAAEWRIHFHVPIFVERYGLLGSTQDAIVETLGLARERPFCGHFEIETYTWEVLPPDLKADLTESIAREYAWVLHGG